MLSNEIKTNLLSSETSTISQEHLEVVKASHRKRRFRIWDGMTGVWEEVGLDTVYEKHITMRYVAPDGLETIISSIYTHNAWVLTEEDEKSLAAVSQDFKGVYKFDLVKGLMRKRVHEVLAGNGHKMPQKLYVWGAVVRWSESLGSYQIGLRDLIGYSQLLAKFREQKGIKSTDYPTMDDLKAMAKKLGKKDKFFKDWEPLFPNHEEFISNSANFRVDSLLVSGINFPGFKY
jgi:hypothetical protein